MAPPYTDTGLAVKTSKWLLHQAFPSECLNCGLEGDWLCAACLTKCQAIKAPTCPFCDRLSEAGKICSRCRANFHLSGGRSLFYYQGPIVPFIHRLKYEGVMSAAPQFAPALAELFNQLPITKRTEVVITDVPSTSKKLAERGFNQSQLLAEAVANIAGVTYKHLLRRDAKATSQTKLSRAERLKNVEDQFHLLSDQPVPSTIVIVDDVITTGATLSSAALALKQGGAKHIWSLTLAKD